MKLKLKPSPVIYEEVSERHFDKRGLPLKHVYTLISNGKLVPGVTTITKPISFPSEIASAWAAKETVKDLAPRQEEIKKATPDEYLAILDTAKNAYRRKADDAKDSGTTAHDFIDAYLIAKFNGTELPKITTIKDKAAKKSVKAFFAWQKQVKPHWLAADTVVGSQVHEFGGRLDAVASIDGIPTLVDFKTSNQINAEYFIQTAGYEIALEEMGIKVWQRMILRFPKDGEGFEAVTVPTPSDLDRESFLGLRQVQRWDSYVKNKNNQVVDDKGKVKLDNGGNQIKN